MLPAASNLRLFPLIVCLFAAAACGDAASDDGDLVAENDALTSGGAALGKLAAGATLVTKANLNLRSAPTIANNVLEVIPNSTQVQAVGGDPQGGFYAIRHGQRTGFASAQFLALVSSAPSADAGAPRSPSSPSSPPSGDFRVAYIGDSHSDYEGNARGAFGFLGQRLTELMAEEGTPLSLFAASGSMPTWWFDDTAQQSARLGYTQTSSRPARQSCGGGTCVPKLAAILADRPSLFVIEQGTNLLGRSESDIVRQIQTMLREIAGKATSCLWVGAPNARTSVHPAQSQDALWRLIRENAAPACATYDSRFLPRTDQAGKPTLDDNGDLIVDVPLPYSPDANNDGEHFGMAAAGKWAAGVALKVDSLRRGHK